MPVPTCTMEPPVQVEFSLIVFLFIRRIANALLACTSSVLHAGSVFQATESASLSQGLFFTSLSTLGVHSING